MLKDTREQMAAALAELRKEFPEDYLSVRAVLDLSQHPGQEPTEEVEVQAWVSEGLGKKGRFVDAKDVAGLAEAVRAELAKIAARKERRKNKRGGKRGRV